MPKLSLKDKLDGNELDLSVMEFKEVPVKELAAIPKATQISLSHNQLISIPASFCELTYLVKLDLSKNQIKDLPANFGKLTCLQSLDLYDNQLEMLPISFRNLAKLKWLDLKNNPLDPQLRSIAGDCLDEKQCQACAKKIVFFMKTVYETLEKERQIKEEKEKAQEAKRQAAMEKAKEKEKKTKKMEKEQRRKAERANRQVQEAKYLSAQWEEAVANGDMDTDVQENGHVKKESSSSKNRKASGMCWRLLKRALLVLVISALSAVSVLYWYTEGNLTTNRIQAALPVIQRDARQGLQVAVARSAEIWKTTWQYVYATHVSLRVGGQNVTRHVLQHAGVWWEQTKDISRHLFDVSLRYCETAWLTSQTYVKQFTEQLSEGAAPKSK